MTHTVYAPAERPEVEVLVEGAWFYGELRMWTQHEDGSWSANVMWTRTHGEHRLDRPEVTCWLDVKVTTRSGRNRPSDIGELWTHPVHLVLACGHVIGNQAPCY